MASTSSPLLQATRRPFSPLLNRNFSYEFKPRKSPLLDNQPITVNTINKSETQKASNDSQNRLVSGVSPLFPKPNQTQPSEPPTADDAPDRIMLESTYEDAFESFFTASRTVGIAQALYDNLAEWPDELAFRRGELLHVVDTAPGGGLADGWWLCCSRMGRSGIAPANRLQLIHSFNDDGDSIKKSTIEDALQGDTKASCRNEDRVVTPRRFGNLFVYDDIDFGGSDHEMDSTSFLRDSSGGVSGGNRPGTGQSAMSNENGGGFLYSAPSPLHKSSALRNGYQSDSNIRLIHGADHPIKMFRPMHPATNQESYDVPSFNRQNSTFSSAAVYADDRSMNASPSPRVRTVPITVECQSSTSAVIGGSNLANRNTGTLGRRTPPPPPSAPLRRAPTYSSNTTSSDDSIFGANLNSAGGHLNSSYESHSFGANLNLANGSNSFGTNLNSSNDSGGFSTLQRRNLNSTNSNSNSFPAMQHREFDNGISGLQSRDGFGRNTPVPRPTPAYLSTPNTNNTNTLARPYSPLDLERRLYDAPPVRVFNQQRPPAFSAEVNNGRPPSRGPTGDGVFNGQVPRNVDMGLLHSAPSPSRLNLFQNLSSGGGGSSSDGGSSGIGLSPGTSGSDRSSSLSEDSYRSSTSANGGMGFYDVPQQSGSGINGRSGIPEPGTGQRSGIGILEDENLTSTLLNVLEELYQSPRRVPRKLLDDYSSQYNNVFNRKTGVDSGLADVSDTSTLQSASVTPTGTLTHRSPAPYSYTRDNLPANNLSALANTASTVKAGASGHSFGSSPIVSNGSSSGNGGNSIRNKTETTANNRQWTAVNGSSAAATTESFYYNQPKPSPLRKSLSSNSVLDSLLNDSGFENLDFPDSALRFGTGSGHKRTVTLEHQPSWTAAAEVYSSGRVLPTPVLSLPKRNILSASPHPNVQQNPDAATAQPNYDVPRLNITSPDFPRRQYTQIFAHTFADKPAAVSCNNGQEQAGVNQRNGINATALSLDDQQRLSVSSVDSKDSDYQELLAEAREVRLSRHDALERLTKLQQSVQTSVAKLCSFVNSNWRQKSALESKLFELKLVCRQTFAHVNELVAFAGGVFVTSVHGGGKAQGGDERLSNRLAHLLRPLRNSLNMLRNALEALDARKWPLTELVRSANTGNDSLDQFIAIAREVPDDCRQVTAFIHGNASQIFSANHSEPEPTVATNHDSERKSNGYHSHSAELTKINGSTSANAYAKPNNATTNGTASSNNADLARFQSANSNGLSASRDTITANQVTSKFPAQIEAVDGANSKSPPPSTPEGLYATVIKTSAVPGALRCESAGLERKAVRESEYETETDGENSLYEDYDYIDPISVDKKLTNGNRVSDHVTPTVPPKPSNHNQLRSSVFSLPKPDADDLQILEFYAPQIEQHIQCLSNAIDKFLQTIEQNAQPPVFVGHSKFVVLAAHKLVYIGDSISQCLRGEALAAHIKSCADRLCEMLKVTVTATKQASLQYPAVPSVQAMVDSMVSVSHASNELKLLIQHVTTM